MQEVMQEVLHEFVNTYLTCMIHEDYYNTEYQEYEYYLQKDHGFTEDSILQMKNGLSVVAHEIQKVVYPKKEVVNV